MLHTWRMPWRSSGLAVRLLRVCAALCSSSARAELCRTMPLEPAGNGAEPGAAALAGCKASDLCEALGVRRGELSPASANRGGCADASYRLPGKPLPLKGLGTHSGEAGVICFPGTKAADCSCKDFREGAASCGAREGRLDQACRGARGGLGCPG